MPYPVAAARGKGLLVEPYLLRDTFTDANATNLTAHTMDVGSGWTAHSGAILIQGNRARSATNGTPDLYSAQANAADVVISAATQIVTTGGVIVAGLVARLSDADNFWTALIRSDTDQFELYEVNAGAFTLRASAAFAPGTTERTLQMTCQGTTITCLVDGGSQIQYASATHNQAATRHGLRAFAESANAREWDAFTVVAP